MAEAKNNFGNKLPSVHAQELAQLSDFIEHLHVLGENPPGDDIRTAAFTKAVIDEIYDPAATKFRGHLIDDLLASPREAAVTADTQVTYKANKLLRASMKYALRKDWQESSNPAFPLEFDKSSSWRSLFSWIVEDDGRSEEFAFDLLTRVVTSNIPQRYYTVPFVVNLFRAVYPDRFVEPPKLLDGGSSQNLGLTKIALGYPFRPVTFYAPGSHTLPDVYDPTMTEQAAQLVGRGLSIGDSWGVDKTRPWDNGALEWTRACDRYPSEHLDTARTNEYDELYNHQHTSPDEVHFAEWDFTRPAKDGKLDIPEKSIDLAIVSNALYLLSGAEIATAMANITRFVKPDGAVAWQEFATFSPNGLPRFYKNPSAKPYRHIVHLMDLSERHPKPREFMRYKTGRCQEAKLGSLGLQLIKELQKQNG